MDARDGRDGRDGSDCRDAMDGVAPAGHAARSVGAPAGRAAQVGSRDAGNCYRAGGGVGRAAAPAHAIQILSRAGPPAPAGALRPDKRRRPGPRISMTMDSVAHPSR